jgi:hypothetical protein
LVAVQFTLRVAVFQGCRVSALVGFVVDEFAPGCGKRDFQVGGGFEQLVRFAFLAAFIGRGGDHQKREQKQYDRTKSGGVEEGREYRHRDFDRLPLLGSISV